MTLPLFDALDTSSRLSEIESTCLPTTGAVERWVSAPSAASETRSGSVVRTVERSGHLLDLPDWRLPIFGPEGELPCRIDGRLADGTAFVCWLVCAL